ncbi:hypothetical protein AVEN_84875-1 [Araneus ventricosus]|uniref:Uncharacterized protein n=1 Tax=Araneus ventricosus TaxID=182803 RepID=A0A4Y2R8V7_ARAVE|nr:hypothetical protein AVEN_84875-1 [Araneus ventricosus]
MTIRNYLRHGCSLSTKQELNPDVIRKPADLPEEASDTWIKVDANLETAEKNCRINDVSRTVNRRDDGIELEDNDEEEDLEGKPPSAQDTLQALHT